MMSTCLSNWSFEVGFKDDDFGKGEVILKTGHEKVKSECNTICFAENSKLDPSRRELVLQDLKRKFVFSNPVSMLHFYVIFSSIFCLRIAVNKKEIFLLLILISSL